MSQLSGLICEILNSLVQGNFTFVRKKSGNFKKTSDGGNRDRPFGAAHTYMAAYIRKYPQGKIYCSSSFLYTIAIIFFE